MTRTRKPGFERRDRPTTAVIFPFDLFGNTGCGSGACLVADELREILADNEQEKVPTRALAYTDNLEICQFDFDTLESLDDWRSLGRHTAQKVLNRGDFLFWIGGNHLSVLPVYEELGGRGEGTHIVQFDAHLDIHHFASCSPGLSNGNFLLHAQKPLPPLFNVGHRELLLTSDFVAQTYAGTLGAEALASNPATAFRKLKEIGRHASGLFLDIDCDVIDPAFFPGVAQPVPLGLSPQQVLALIDLLWSDKVLGVALSEFHPAYDEKDRSLSLLIWLLEYLLLKRHEKKS